MNKRQLKKQIHGLCGRLACDCVIATMDMPCDVKDKTADLVVRVAHAQTAALSKVSVSFDKTPRDFANRHEYNVERRKYFKKALGALSSELNNEVISIVNEINEMLTPEQKEANKAKAAAK